MKNDLYGLILAGGRSRRMRAEKASLVYHETPQVHRCFELLAGVCESAYVSLRAQQANLAERWEFPRIYDRWEDRGPLGGILSAMKKFPERAWLVLACDKPLVGREVLQTLIDRRDRGREATAYRIPGQAVPEPLCTIYEPQIEPRLFEALEMGRLSPRRVLEESAVKIIEPDDEATLKDVNTPEQYRSVRMRLRNRQEESGR